MQGQDRFIPINGLRLHYLEWGDRRGRPVVLLHGGAAHAHWWDFFAASMADGYRVLAFDLRGHGDSEHADPPGYRLDDYTNDLFAAVESLALEPFDLIGHSLGALIATAYTARSERQLKTLVVIDAQPRISPAGARYMERLRYFPHPVYRDRETAIRRFRLLPTQTNAAAEVLAHVAAHGIRQLPDGRWTLKFDREWLAFSEPLDLTGALQRLRCPILIVRGAHSTLLPRERFAALLTKVPGARGVEIPDAHHHVMLDNPPAFAQVVRQFLDQRRDLNTDSRTP